MDKNQKRGRPKTFNREVILEIAMNNYWQKGLSVSLNSISEQAGVAKPSLYREFENEDGLTLAALNRYSELIGSRLNSILSSDDSFLDKINTLAQYFCQDVCHNNGCLFVKMRSQSFKVGPKTKARIEEIEQEMLHIYVNFFEHNKNELRSISHLSTQQASKFLSSQFELALAQRARGVPSEEVRAVLNISLAIFSMSGTYHL
jgi:AcrR family transcriptional regulator